jgi:hypothetical protein
MEVMPTGEQQHHLRRHGSNLALEAFRQGRRLTIQADRGTQRDRRCDRVAAHGSYRGTDPEWRGKTGDARRCWSDRGHRWKKRVGLGGSTAWWSLRSPSQTKFAARLLAIGGHSCLSAIVSHGQALLI